MTTAREQARLAVFQTTDRTGMSTDLQRHADAASDVWEPLLNDLVTSFNRGSEDEFYAALLRAEKALP